MRGRRLISLAIALILGLSVGASLVVAQQKPYQGITLNVALTRMREDEVFAKQVEEVARELGMKVRIAWFESQAFRHKMVLDAQAGVTTWDIVALSMETISPLVAAGAVTPFNDFINNPELADPVFRKAWDNGEYLGYEMNISDGFWAPKGAIWAIPYTMLGNVLGYRKDLLNNPLERTAFKQRYGYELQVPVTMEQYRDIAEFFTRKKGDTLAGKVLDHDFYGISHSFKPGSYIWHDYALYAAAFGYTNQFFDRETLQATWDSPLNKLTMQFVMSLKPFMPEEVIVMGSGESAGLFAAGKVFMIIEYMSRVIWAATNKEESRIAENVGIAPVPSVKGCAIKRPSMVSVCSVGIAANSKHKEAAYKLIETVQSYANQKKTVIEYTLPAAISTVYKDPDVIKQVPVMGEVMNALAESYLFTDPFIKEFESIMDITATSLCEVITEQKTLDEAFKQAQDKLAALLREKGYTK